MTKGRTNAGIARPIVDHRRSGAIVGSVDDLARTLEPLFSIQLAITMDPMKNQPGPVLAFNIDGEYQESRPCS